MKKGDFDVFVSTYYDPFFLKYLNSKPFVLTVYDMIHELFPEYFVNDPFDVTIRKKILIEKSTKIIAVSENTKKDILKIYPQTDPNKIHVVYHGNSIKYNSNVQVNLPEKYLLYVGSRATYKNFMYMLDAIKKTLKAETDLYLVCAGGGDFNKQEVVLFKEYNLEDKIFHFNFKEEELGAYYKNAICFVFPSMYEGFGIPVLEAMSCECPVVLGKHSSFTEVAADAGIYFDVNDKNDLNEKIKMVLKKTEIRELAIAKGMKQSEKFSWKKASIECMEVYKSSLKPM